MECGAKKRDGTPCKAPAMANGRCRIHGGKSPKGMLVNTYKTGKYSKYLPARMQERYTAAVNDSELLSLRSDLALMEARIADLLTRVDTGEAGKAWQEIKAVYRDLSYNFNAKNTTGVMRSMADMQGILDRGYADYQAWNELQACLEQKRRLQESEQKRLVAMGQMVTAEEGMGLAMALLNAVRSVVSDRRQLSAIQNEFIRLTQFKRVTESVDDGGQ